MRCVGALRTSICRFFGLSERAPRFVDDATSREMYDAGMEFIRQSVLLNRLSMNSKRKWWLIKPKLHMYREQLERLRK